MVNMSDITSMYSDVYASAANQTANKLKSQMEGTDYSKATEEELMDACKQFEAYFVEQIYKGMMKTIPQNEDTSNYTSMITDYYKDQMIQSVAAQTTEQSSIGLAQMLFEQMKRNYGIGVVDPRQAQDADNAEEESSETEAIDQAAGL